MGGKVEKREGEAERRKETSPIPNIGTKSAPNSTLAHSLITRLRATDGARSLMTTPDADARRSPASFGAQPSASATQSSEKREKICPQVVSRCRSEIHARCSRGKFPFHAGEKSRNDNRSMQKHPRLLSDEQHGDMGTSSGFSGTHIRAKERNMRAGEIIA